MALAAQPRIAADSPPLRFGERLNATVGRLGEGTMGFKIYASAFSQLDGFAVPIPVQVTQTAGQIARR